MLKISTSLQTIRYGFQYNYVDNTLKDQAITITATITLKRRAQNNVNNNDNKILNKYVLNKFIKKYIFYKKQQQKQFVRRNIKCNVSNLNYARALPCYTKRYLL